jgi:hypothetical protein
MIDLNGATVAAACRDELGRLLDGLDRQLVGN